jgi:hypothetical protein
LSLLTFRPERPTDMAELSEILQSKDARKAALPAELPEPLLLAVARDLRWVEDENQDDESQSMTAPLALVLCLLYGTSMPTPKEGKLSISEEAIWEVLRAYQWAVEREIVTRLTGIGGRNDESFLLDQLSKAKHS